MLRTTCRRLGAILALAVMSFVASVPAVPAGASADEPDDARLDAAPDCALHGAREPIVLPESGFVELDAAWDDMRCADADADGWVWQPGRTVDLGVHADGPSGSGRYWEVTVAWRPTGASLPSGGVCFRTSTLGWRTLQSFRRLDWVEDGDGDGYPELVRWRSFPLAPDPAMTELGIVAEVFEFHPRGELVFDALATRRIAAELASAYRQPPPGAAPSSWDAFMLKLRTRAADALQRYADGNCPS